MKDAQKNIHFFNH